MKIVVGCPTRKRTWILEQWREHVERAVPGNWDLSYVLVCGEDDRETLDLVDSWKRTSVLTVTEPVTEDVRSWGDGTRYEHMVFLRNTMLEHVRKASPELFLSIDSDILLSQDAVRDMHDTMQSGGYDAVGGLTWLDPVDAECTNIAMWSDKKKMSGFKRVLKPGTHKVDIIMAVKLMGKKAYNVDYEYHRLGEDLGWSKRMKEAGLVIGCDGRNPSRHVMGPKWLDKKDKRLTTY